MSPCACGFNSGPINKKNRGVGGIKDRWSMELRERGIQRVGVVCRTLFKGHVPWPEGLESSRGVGWIILNCVSYVNLFWEACAKRGSGICHEERPVHKYRFGSDSTNVPTKILNKIPTKIPTKKSRWVHNRNCFQRNDWLCSSRDGCIIVIVFKEMIGYALGA